MSDLRNLAPAPQASAQFHGNAEISWQPGGIVEMIHGISGRREKHIPVAREDGTPDYAAGRVEFDNGNGVTGIKNSTGFRTSFPGGTEVFLFHDIPTDSVKIKEFLKNRKNLTPTHFTSVIAFKFPDGSKAVTTKTPDAYHAEGGTLFRDGRFEHDFERKAHKTSLDDGTIVEHHGDYTDVTDMKTGKERTWRFFLDTGRAFALNSSANPVERCFPNGGYAFNTSNKGWGVAHEIGTWDNLKDGRKMEERHNLLTLPRPAFPPSSALQVEEGKNPM